MRKQKAEAPANEAPANEAPANEAPANGDTVEVTDVQAAAKMVTDIAAANDQYHTLLLAGVDPATAANLLSAKAYADKAITVRVSAFLHKNAADISLVGMGALMGAALGGLPGAALGGVCAALAVALRELLQWVARKIANKTAKKAVKKAEPESLALAS